ncbi:MAG TPA: hypothetical protein PLN05_05300 [Pyrinomonadaceae bacterium]|nr:hypothetical protein [Chloracidobacterium sp.]HBE83939.1 hypothetical protein [Blastocatellia bacterium]HRJ87437.1 hypothetical protein [Pyrinomonadaceae bacterium]HRK49828.1 hypothetical protein [Pyrinomonadaceae bacterium]
MTSAAEFRNSLGDSWIPTIYEDRIRKLRTRSFELDIPERENDPTIEMTLLGVELRVGRKRIACPDIETARYLAIFAILGCAKVAVPYDITQIGPLAAVLEDAWREMDRKFAESDRDASPQTIGKRRAAILRTIRIEIARIGAGEMMPLFNRSTRQRQN